MSLVIHSLKPIYSASSAALILGTIPSPKSREAGFFYGHPHNSFWRVLAAVFCAPVPVDNAEKTRLILDNRLALWDVLHSCEITGASDSSIKSPVVNDFTEVLAQSEITRVFTTGKAATELYTKFCYEQTRIPCVYLPSTSPANRRFGFTQLVEAYSVLRTQSAPQKPPGRDI